MIVTRVEFLNRTKLSQHTLDVWIEEEWLVPEATDAELTFSEADIARAQLISDLSEELGVNSEGIGVILHLLDQMHGLRSALASLVESKRSKNEGL
jgi:chaperone modulatory protein CbpM